MTADSTDILDLLRQADGLTFPPAGGGALAALLLRAEQRLGMVPPGDYLDFLGQSDGGVANGLMLYGTRSQRFDKMEMPELVEINLRRRVYRQDEGSFLQIGEIDDDLLGVRATDQLYWRLDRPSGELHDPSDSLKQLVGQLIGRPG